MTLIEITNKLKFYAQNLYVAPTVTVGSVYENMNTDELKYPVVNYDTSSTIKRNNEIIYSFYVYYSDRLNEDGSNMLEIQSQANTALQIILKNILDSGAMTLDEFYDVIITPFKMKFADMCAGAWMQINIHSNDSIDYCDDGSVPPAYKITENGLYNVNPFDMVDVDVHDGTTPTGETTIVENGEYDVTDYATAIVQIPTEEYYQSGYQSGHTDGYAVGAVEGFTSGYTSGHTDGYNEGFGDGYSSGRTDGYNEGYVSGKTDGFDDGYQSGRTDGVASVPLASTGFTQNGVYVPSAGGWNSVTVNVPSVTTQSLTQQEYDALPTKDPMVIYLITE